MRTINRRSLPLLISIAAASIGTLAIAFQGASLPDLKMSDLSNLGQSVTNASVRATVKNTGPAQLSAVLAFYKGSVFAGNAVEISRLDVTWKGYEVRTIQSEPVTLADGDLYSACVDPGNATPETNENNNCSVATVSKAYTDLSVNAVDIGITPVGANAGEPMKVNALIRNNGTVPARALVRLYQGHPESPSARQLGALPIGIAAKSSGAASWNIVRPAGDTNLFVSVDNVVPRELVPKDNLAARNIYVKAIIDTGRGFGNAERFATSPAVGDLFGNGQPVMVFAERVGNSSASEVHLTVLQVFNDGTTKEHWSKRILPAYSSVVSPSIADLDGDGSPEIVLMAMREFTTNTTREGEIYVFAFDKNGNEKWSHSWRKPGRAPCRMGGHGVPPVLGDMNKDGIADVVVIEEELVMIDGRNGGELVRAALPGNYSWCNNTQYAAIADVDGDGENEYIVGAMGIHVFNSNGSLRWKTAAGTYYFSLVDLEKDGKAEIVVPVHRTSIDVYDGQTGQLKKRVVPNPWRPSDQSMGVTTSIDPNGLPSLAIANNDTINGTALLDASLSVRWWQPTPIAHMFLDHPQHVVLADILGQGRPQVISRSASRSFGIQDITTGQWLVYTQLYGFGTHVDTPIPVDVDGDGRGEVIVNYGSVASSGTPKGEYEAEMPAAHFLVFGSEHWKKIPTTWNQQFFVPNQVDKKLAFRHDYQPYKTHNTWMQQPMRMACDIDYDDDVDQTDVNLIFAARNKRVPGYDPRDYDKDGTITLLDGRACATRCTKENCTVSSQPGQILSVSPRTAFPGSAVQVTIRGEFANLKAGVTKASFGPGIAVGGAPAGTPGPVNVIDSETAVAQLTIQAGQTGTRTVTLVTGSSSASRPEAFALSSGNHPPAVSVSADQRVILPSSVTLTGNVTDDGMPNGKLQTIWQLVAGPGTVAFSNPDGLSTTATFAKEGFYHVRLSATDGQYFSSADTGITVQLGNDAPYVSAGPDVSTYTDTDFRIAGQAHDDGLPVGSSIAVQWSKTIGSGSVTFTPANDPNTRVRFSQPGIYVLKLTATDGVNTASDEAIVTVTPPPAELQSLSPASAAPGQTRTVILIGKHTNFVNGQTEANFGSGVSVNGSAPNGFGKVTVTDARTAIAQITVNAGTQLGARSVTIRTGPELASKTDAFVVGSVGVPHSIRLKLSDVVVAPGESITATPELLDAAGNLLSDPGLPFTMQATPKPGAAVGSAPVIDSLSVSFPKLVKRLLNHDVEKDPTGEFTDGDPSDPNYGKETGGLYTLTVRLNGTNVTGTAEVAVLPSGTAKLTLRVDDLADQFGNSLNAVQNALAARNVAAAAAARASLQTILNTTEFSPKLLANNNVLTPPNGFPLSISEVAARFPASPDDEQFGTQLDSIIAHVRLVRSRIELLQAATITPETVETLRSAANTYKTLSQALEALEPGPVGVTRNGDEVNELLRNELPGLLLALTRKSAELLRAIPGMPNVALKAEYSPERLAVDPSQLWDIFSNLFSIFTDLKGYCKGNIIELGISLANDLANIALANAVNDLSPGGLAIDLVAAGGQFSFVCPAWQNTYVEATGFSPIISNNSVAVIGCINSYALRSLLTLKPAKDLAASIRLFSKIKSLAEAAGRDQSIATVEHPDTMREGLFGGTQIVFTPGWPRVNQGRIPCVGVVIAFNLETGSFHAVNANMLPTCQ